NDVEPTVRYNPERILPSLKARQMSAHESTETTAPPGISHGSLNTAAGTSSTAELEVLPPHPIPLPPKAERDERTEDLGQTLHTVDQQAVIERIMGQLPPPVDSEAETSTEHDDLLTDHDPEAVVEDISNVSTPFSGLNAALEDPADRTLAGEIFENHEVAPSADEEDSSSQNNQATKPLIAANPAPRSEEPTRRGIKTPPVQLPDTEPDDPPWDDTTHAFPEVDETELGASKTQPNRVVDPDLADESTLQGSFDTELGRMEAMPWVAEPPLEVDASLEREYSRRPSPGELVPTRKDSTPPASVMRQEARRRYSSDGVVLYGYDEDGPETADLAVEYEADPSIQGIVDEGRLADAGASGLFGALSILDDRKVPPPSDEEETDGRGFNPEPKVPPSIERSVNAMFADFSESMGRVRALSTSGPQGPSEGSETRMGDLADPIDGLPNFQLDRDESTRGFRSDDELSLRDGADLPELDAHSLVRAATPSVVGLRLELGEASADFADSLNEEDPAIEGIPIVAGRRASEPEPRYSSNQPTPLDGLSEDGSWRSDALEEASFELNLEESIVAPNALRGPSIVPRGLSAEPVRPVSMIRAPGGVEETANSPVFASSSRGGSAALRAVVGRRGKIKELNRAQPAQSPTTPERSTPIVVPAHNAAATPDRMRGAPGRNRGAISPRGPFGTPGIASGSGPSWNNTPSALAARSRWLTVAVFGLPLLAVILTVAALVSSMINQPPFPGAGRVIPVPEDVAGRPTEPEAPASSQNFDDSPAQNAPPKLGTVHIECKKATTLRIRGAGADVANPIVVRRLKPGRYRIRLSRNGRTLRRKVIEVVAGETTTLTCP
ncbi:MAG: hypothetical protein AAF449_12590, partial [Myxococcota bacterium]